MRRQWVRMGVWVPAVGVVLAAGCAQKTLVRPTTQPASEWRGRTLYEGQGSSIYATSESAARDAARVLDRVAKDLAAQGGTVPRGVLIALDTADELPVADAEAYFRFVARAERGAKAPLAPADAKKRWERFVKQSDNNGLPAGLQLKMRPVLLDKEVLSGGLGIPPSVSSEAQWGMVIPTEAAIRHATDRMVDAAEGEPLQNLFVLAMGADKPRMVRMQASIRDAMLCTQLVVMQREWSREKRAEFLKAFIQRWRETARK